MNPHIGLEFTKYIHLSIGTIDGHTMMVIECERADALIFLISKKDESFYVGSGPSSLSLSMRQMLRYQKSRTLDCCLDDEYLEVAPGAEYFLAISNKNIYSPSLVA